MCTVVTTASAQPQRGMVWNPPTNEARAVSELFEIKATGVEALRTPLLLSDTLYATADSLGLQLYQDLPFQYMPANTLLDSLDYAKQLIREAVRWADRYASVRHFGLGRHNDTSEESACTFFKTVAQEARRYSAQSLLFYQISTFIEDEQCADAVDIVLLDVRNETEPLSFLKRWRERHPDQVVGFGALGTWVEPASEDDDGYRLLNSPAYQARYLEDHLNAIFQTDSQIDLASVFVYRWSDIRLQYPSVSHNLKYPFRHSYGLKTNRGTSRPAYQVIRGIYTREQTVFAFPVGEEKSPGASWIILLGWFTIALLGIAYAYFPRFSPNVRRYFSAHGFYRSAVEEGRELLFGPTLLLLVVVMISFGIAGTVILDTVRVSEAFSALVRWLPQTSRSTLVALLSNQLVMILVLASVFAVAVTIWTSVLSATTARNRRRLLPGQTFMLVVWPQWPLILAMVAAIVISTLDKIHAPMWALVLFVLLALALLAAVVRAYRDYAGITRPNFFQTLIACLGNPFVLILIAGIYLSIQYGDKFAFFWHLIVRT